MSPELLDQRNYKIEQAVSEFEAAWARRERADLRAHLVPESDPDYRHVLCELIRVELELSQRQGRPKTLREYFRDFPELLEDPECRDQLAFEESRLRRQVGTSSSSPSNPLSNALRQIRAEDTEEKNNWTVVPSTYSVNSPRNGRTEPSDRLPADPSEPTDASWPSVGDRFLEFTLIEELGRGASGRVYLARQGDLANRPVVLKLTRRRTIEPQALARLQHPAIVPIHSVHRLGALHAICMPYRGRTTLADLLNRLRQHQERPRTARDLLALVQEIQHASISTVGALTFQLENVETSNGQAGSESGLIEDTLDCGIAPRLHVPTEPSPAIRPIDRSDKGESHTSSTASKTNASVTPGASAMEAVLRVASSLTEGLAHAHARGILHRDLKPANILLDEPLDPLLLDFDLAADLNEALSATDAVVGGTLPYMSPQQLGSFLGARLPAEPADDLYALGVILYEWVTGRHPFPIRHGPLDQLLPQMIADRQAPPPSAHSVSKRVPHAVASILQRCLEPDPQQRYRSADQLGDDLQRQLTHRHLKHAPDPSTAERLGKWRRRHPRLALALAILMLSGLAILGTVLSLKVDRARLERFDAVTQMNRFLEEAEQARALLIVSTYDRNQLDRALNLGHEAIGAYGGPEQPDGPSTMADLDARLNAEKRDRLGERIGELLTLTALGEALADDRESDSEPESEPPGQTHLERAQSLLDRAVAFYQPDQQPHALRELSAYLKDRRSGARTARFRDVPIAPRTLGDYYLLAAQYMAQRRYEVALPLLLKVVGQSPERPLIWLQLGLCHEAMGRPDEAAACYSNGIASWPRFHHFYLERGLIRLRQGDYGPARTDFDLAIDLNPDLADAYINRALARRGLGDAAGAIADYTLALERATGQTRIYFMRAKARDQLGDRQGATRDRHEGLRREPGDVLSWVARGLAWQRLEGDLDQALADIEQALMLDSRSPEALHNKAYILEQLGRLPQAIDMLDRLLEVTPEDLAALRVRGVFKARLGHRREAHRDAEEALRRDVRPETLYQVAGIYALTSTIVPEDRRRALELLQAALAQGYPTDQIDDDRDLDPIRDDPQFPRAVAVPDAAPSGSGTHPNAPTESH